MRVIHLLLVCGAWLGGRETTLSWSNTTGSCGGGLRGVVARVLVSAIGELLVSLPFLRRVAAARSPRAL